MSEEDKIAQVCEVCHVEIEAARQLLEATQWSVEEALTLHFAGHDAVTSQATSSAASSSRPPRAPSSDVTPPAISERSGFLGALGRAVSASVQAFTGIASEDFDQWFLDRFGPPAPSFCKTSFGDAVQKGLNEGMLVMAWFHEADGPATERFCRELLQNELVLGLLQDTYLLWAGDVCRFEPSQIARLMGLTKFPSLVLLQPLANGFDTNFLCVEWPLGTFCQPLHRCLPEQEGAPPDIDLAIATITTTSQDFQDEVQMEQEHRNRRTAQLTEARQLREQQDREYEEALLQDQLAAVRRVEGEEIQASPAADSPAQAEAAREAECRAKEKADQEAAAAAEAAEAEEEARRKQRGAEILTNPEPATGAEPTARIRLQLPSGERLQRNFRADQCLEEVYDWAHCCRPQAKPKRFELCISFPARTLTERSATLQELDLVPSAALVLREAES